MRASIDSVWIALEVGQKAVLAAPLMPEAAFLALDCLALLAALISLVCESGVLGLVWCSSNLRFRLLHAFASHPSSLGSKFLHIQNLLHPSPHRWMLVAQTGGLFSIERVVRLLSYQRTPSFLTHIWIQKILRQQKSWSFTIPKYNLILFAAVTFRDETNLFVSMPNICKIAL